MPNALGFMQPCPLYFLRDVAWVVNRQFYNVDVDELEVTIRSIALMVNRDWCDMSVTFLDKDIRKALIELQAMEVLQFEWVGYSAIRTPNVPYVEPTEELWDETFFCNGFLGSYINPTPIHVMESTANYLASYENRDIPLRYVAADFQSSPETVLKILRELRIMRVIHYTRRDDNVQIIMICSEALTRLNRRRFFGDVNE